MISGRNSERIKLEAQRLGFFYCGIAKAEKLEEDEPRLETWLKKGCMVLCSTWKIILIKD